MKLRYQTLPDRVEQRPEALRLNGMLQVQAIAVELGDAAGGDEHAGRVAAEFEEVEGCEERFADGRGEAVVWGRDEGEEVDGR